MNSTLLGRFKALPQLRSMGWFSLKALLSGIVLVWLVNQMAEQARQIVAPWEHLNGLGIAFLACAAALVPLNYWLEAVKWHVFMRRQANSTTTLPLREALRGVWLGHVAGVATPNRWGEYVGRVQVLSPEQRKLGGVATFYCRLAQLMPTLLGGCLALLAFLNAHKPLPDALSFWATMFAGFFGIAVLLLALTPIMSIQFLNAAIGKFHFLKKFELPFLAFSEPKLVAVLKLAFVRYLVIVLQYVCLFCAFGAAQAGTGLGALFLLSSLIFFVKSFIPSVTLAELGIRESLAVYLGAIFFIPPEVALNATLGLFLLNLVLPSGMGLYHLTRLPRRSARGNLQAGIKS